MKVNTDNHVRVLPLPEAGIILADVERAFVEQALAKTQGNQSAAARLLGITRWALRGRMKKFGLQLETKLAIGQGVGFRADGLRQAR